MKKCKWEDSCDCMVSTKKVVSCRKCKHYQFIDSGYGYCKALPKPIVVAYCKDICGLFKESK